MLNHHCLVLLELNPFHLYYSLLRMFFGLAIPSTSFGFQKPFNYQTTQLVTEMVPLTLGISAFL